MSGVSTNNCPVPPPVHTPHHLRASASHVVFNIEARDEALQHHLA